VEAGQDLDLVVMPFPPRAKARAFLAINPLGTVPAFIDGELQMTESSAIAQYLAALYSPRNLSVEADESDYGAYLDFLHHADATLTFPQTVFMRFSLFEKHRGLEAGGEAYGAWFGARLVKLERRLEDREYLCADRFTAADIAIAFALHLSTQIGLDAHLTPRLRRYLEAMTARPGFATAVALEAEAARAYAGV